MRRAVQQKSGTTTEPNTSEKRWAWGPLSDATYITLTPMLFTLVGYENDNLNPPTYLYFCIVCPFVCQEGIYPPHCAKQRQQEQDPCFCVREEEQKFPLLATRTLDKITQETAVDADWEGNQSLLNT